MASVTFSKKFTDIVALDSGGFNGALLDFYDPENLLNTKFDHEGEKTALVLGANGFVGCHFLNRVLTEPKIKKVFAIVRPMNGQDGLQRLSDAMTLYGMPMSQSSLNKLTCITGIYTDSYFGCSESTFDMLTHEVDLIYHCANNNDYKLTYFDYRDYVLSFLDLLAFSITHKKKQINFVSSVAYKFLQTQQDFQRPDTVWYSGYSQMKWIITQLHAEAVTKGIVGCVYMPAAYILGPASTGINPGFSYTLWRMVRLMHKAKKVFKNLYLQVVSGDILADIAIKNSLSLTPCSYMEISQKTMDVTNMASLLGCEIVEWEEFKCAVQNLPSSTGDGKSLLTDELHQAIEKVLIKDNDNVIHHFYDHDLPSSYDVVKANWQYLKGV